MYSEHMQASLFTNSVPKPYIPPKPPEPIAQIKKPTPELRALRLWHWLEVIACSHERIVHEKSKRTVSAQKAVAKHNLHMRAVQTLNDCFEVDDTAENDYSQALSKTNIKL
jgi:hypothetical protein